MTKRRVGILLSVLAVALLLGWVFFEPIAMLFLRVLNATVFKNPGMIPPK